MQRESLENQEQPNGDSVRLRSRNTAIRHPRERCEFEHLSDEEVRFGLTSDLDSILEAFLFVSLGW